jgi:hypothetical protein
MGRGPANRLPPPWNTSGGTLFYFVFACFALLDTWFQKLPQLLLSRALNKSIKR